MPITLTGVSQGIGQFQDNQLRQDQFRLQQKDQAMREEEFRLQKRADEDKRKRDQLVADITELTGLMDSNYKGPLDAKFSEAAQQTWGRVPTHMEPVADGRGYKFETRSFDDGSVKDTWTIWDDGVMDTQETTMLDKDGRTVKAESFFNPETQQRELRPLMGPDNTPAVTKDPALERANERRFVEHEGSLLLYDGNGAFQKTLRNAIPGKGEFYKSGETWYRRGKNENGEDVLIPLPIADPNDVGTSKFKPGSLNEFEVDAFAKDYIFQLNDIGLFSEYTDPDGNALVSDAVEYTQDKEGNAVLTNLPQSSAFNKKISNAVKAAIVQYGPDDTSMKMAAAAALTADEWGLVYAQKGQSPKVYDAMVNFATNYMSDEQYEKFLKHKIRIDRERAQQGKRNDVSIPMPTAQKPPR